MKFTLNTEKSPFCTIGPFAFSLGNESYDIEVDPLPDDYKKQLLYNLNRGVLLSDDKEGIASLSGTIQRATPIPQEQVPIQHDKVSKKVNTIPKDAVEQDLKPLKALLRKTVSTVKKEAAGMTPSQVRKLLELEKGLKNRKSIINFLSDILEKHELSVMSSLGEEEENLPTVVDPLTVDPRRSTQVSDIVESDVESISFPQGNLVQQEVLGDYQE